MEKELNAHRYQVYKHYVKCVQLRPEFELGLACQFPSMITITSYKKIIFSGVIVKAMGGEIVIC